MPGGPDQRSRSSWPATIHGCAQSGDLPGLQKRLHDNPSLLNDRNPGMSQTPLHVASGCNNIAIVKFLLEWKGAENVELEAKNMYGETPLHMTAKNGCNESARMLLDRSASLEAKANNGMTPLHLAVWQALHSEDCTTVSTLLQYNADCSVKDNEGMTPLNHLSQGPASQKLRELLNRHIDEQKRRKSIESCSEAKVKMAEFEAAMSGIVGLQGIKLQLHKWARGMLFDEKRRAMGLSVAPRKTPHMAFLGNPGTVCTPAHSEQQLAKMMGTMDFQRKQLARSKSKGVWGKLLSQYSEEVLPKEL